jgi:hypothetical protein
VSGRKLGCWMVGMLSVKLDSSGGRMQCMPNMRQITILGWTLITAMAVFGADAALASTARH